MCCFNKTELRKNTKILNIFSYASRTSKSWYIVSEVQCMLLICPILASLAQDNILATTKMQKVLFVIPLSKWLNGFASSKYM